MGVLCVVCPFFFFFLAHRRNCSIIERTEGKLQCGWVQPPTLGVTELCRGHSFSLRHFVMTEPISSLLHGHWEHFVLCLFASSDSSSNCFVVERAEEKLQCDTGCLVLPTFCKGRTSSLHLLMTEPISLLLCRHYECFVLYVCLPFLILSDCRHRVSGVTDICRGRLPTLGVLELTCAKH